MLVVLLLAAALAQSAGGTISGRVDDQSGAVLPGAGITVRNLETGVARMLVTDEGGRYYAPNLSLGEYEVRAELPGFSSGVRSGIRLTVGREAVVDFQLQVGQIAENVTVTGEAPLIQLTTASTEGLIDELQMQTLPLNGRSFIELAAMVPGVQIAQAGARSASVGYGIKLSVNGARYTANLFTIDGTQINDEFNQAGSASGNVLGVEAIREFQVLTNSFSAEYGRHTGAVINAATKAGTNELHGSVFEFLRNDNLDARNFFDAEKKPEFKRNQFGAALGGPIVRDKTFFFGNYEGLREGLGQTSIWTVPTAQFRSSPAVDPIVRPYLESYPLPNGRQFDANRAELLSNTSRTTDEDYLIGRIDQNFSSKSNVFGRYIYNAAIVDDPNRTITGQITRTRFQYATIEHAYVLTPRLLNRFQVAYTRNRLAAYDYILPGLKLPRTTFTDITRGIGAITIQGFSGWGGTGTNPKYHVFNNYQLNEQMAYTAGAHNMKFGALIERPEYNLTSDFTSMGEFTFNSVNDFANRNVLRFSSVLPGSDAVRTLRQIVVGTYFQDDFHLRPNLTLNWGLRYEFHTDHSETHDRLAQLIDFANPKASFTDTTPLKTLFRNPSKRNFAPRIGIAWDPQNNHKTAIRAGFGVYYDLMAINNPVVQNTAVRVPPYFMRAGLVAGGQVPRVDFPDAYTTQRSALAGTAELEGIQYNPDQPYMMKWNLNIQREIFNNTTIEAGYTGTRAVHLLRVIHTNGREAFINSNGRLQVLPTTPLRQPNFGRMRLRLTDSTSDYHGLTTSFNRRLNSGLQVQVSYTFSKALDDGASVLGNDFDTDGGGSRYLFSKDRGRAVTDLAHVFSTNINYRLPFGENGQGWSRLAQGWSLGSLLRVSSGPPFSVTAGYDASLQVYATSYPDLRAGASNNPILGGPDRYYDPNAFVLPPNGVIGNLGRNTLEAPGLATVDMVLAKDSRISGEKATLQFRTEVFNIFNHPNFGVPVQTIFASSGQVRADAGRITRTTTSARQIQFGLKLLW